MQQDSSTTGKRPEHVLLIMVDGVGIPEIPLAESIYRDCPVLGDCIEQYSVPLDATLGIPGEPQSATGQTALFTGVNAPVKLGKHLSGFPNAELRKIITRNNIFLRLQAKGLNATFANAYARHTEQTLPKSFRSVTTVAALSAFEKTRDRDDLTAGRAVYHDLTRHWLREHSKLDVPIISEEEAALNLLTITRTVDFCLFEYFLTDHAGHRGTLAQKQEVLTSLNKFFGTLIENLNTEKETFIWTSDHGNIEDPDTTRHTCNPVPFSVIGGNEPRLRQGMTSIQQVTPRILDLLTA